MEKRFNSFLSAMKDYFGYKPGQNMQGFAEECRALDPDDRAYFTRELAKVGYVIA